MALKEVDAGKRGSSKEVRLGEGQQQVIVIYQV
jgi:hypothetical protein